jgi:hypothetical protein
MGDFVLFSSLLGGRSLDVLNDEVALQYIQLGFSPLQDVSEDSRGLTRREVSVVVVGVVPNAYPHVFALLESTVLLSCHCSD